MVNNTPRTSGPSAETAQWLEVVNSNVNGLHYGSVQITIHDGKVTQVESIQKTRFPSAREERRAAR